MVISRCSTSPNKRLFTAVFLKLLENRSELGTKEEWHRQWPTNVKPAESSCQPDIPGMNATPQNKTGGYTQDGAAESRVWFIKDIDSIQSAGLRLALDTLCTSPLLNLFAKAGVPPLRYRSLSLAANFLASSVQYPSILPIFPSFLYPHNSPFLSLQSTYLNISN